MPSTPFKKKKELLRNMWFIREGVYNTVLSDKQENSSGIISYLLLLGEEEVRVKMVEEAEDCLSYAFVVWE